MNKANPFPKNMSSNAEYFLVSAIILLGIFLRFLHLGKESFWLDETYTASLIQHNPYFILNTTAADVHPPIYYLLLHFITRIIGSTEFTLRLPSVLLGVLSLAVFWKLGKYLFSQNVAVAGTFLLSISTLHIQYCQEARANILLLLSVLSSYYLLFLLKKEKKSIYMVGYFLATSIAIWTHNLGIAYIALQVLWILIENLVIKRGLFPWKKWLLAFGLALLSYTPWISIVMHQIQEVGSGTYWLGFAVWQNFANSIYVFSGSLIGFILIIPLIIYAFCVHIKNENFRGMFFLAFISPFFIWLISTFLIPIYITRNILPSLPAFLLLSALGLTIFRYKPVNIALIAVFCISSFPTLYSYYTVVQKDQWREVANYLEDNLNPQDQVYFKESFGKVGLNWYLDKNSYETINNPDEHAWLVLYANDNDKNEDLLNQRVITEFYNVIIAHPVDN